MDDGRGGEGEDERHLFDISYVPGIVPSELFTTPCEWELSLPSHCMVGG